MTKSSRENLLNMLGRFDNETEHGKLFISYPMIEAIRDFQDIDEYLVRTVAISDCVGARYKQLSANRGNHAYRDAKKIDKQGWQILIEANLRKANILTTHKDTLVCCLTNKAPHTCETIASRARCTLFKMSSPLAFQT